MNYETTINVAYGKDGTKTHEVAVLSYMVGDYLAVHESPDDDDMWTITHVPTGFACRSRITSYNQAVDLAHEIKDMIDWNFTNPKDALNQEGYNDLLNTLYPDRERKPDPISESFKTEWVKPQTDDKLATLLWAEGLKSELEFMETFITDSLCPGICMNEDCDYTTMYEQDQNEGWCELCDTGTVKSGMLLMGMI